MKSLLIACLVLLAACQEVPQYRMPAKKIGYRLPPCEVARAGVPCRQPQVYERKSACEKRFGKICSRT